MATTTYPMPEGGWVCFHCGDKFTTVGAAQDHFGGEVGALAACQIKAGDERGLVMEMRKAQQSRDEWMDRALRVERDVESLECRVESLTSAMQSYAPFRECRSINDVFFLFDSVEGRAIAAEEQLARIGTPGVAVTREPSAAENALRAFGHWYITLGHLNPAALIQLKEIVPSELLKQMAHADCAALESSLPERGVGECEWHRNPRNEGWDTSCGNYSAVPRYKFCGFCGNVALEAKRDTA